MTGSATGAPDKGKLGRCRGANVLLSPSGSIPESMDRKVMGGSASVTMD